jgi:hypothetical protein
MPLIGCAVVAFSGWGSIRTGIGTGSVTWTGPVPVQLPSGEVVGTRLSRIRMLEHSSEPGYFYLKETYEDLVNFGKLINSWK